MNFIWYDSEYYTILIIKGLNVLEFLGIHNAPNGQVLKKLENQFFFIFMVSVKSMFHLLKNRFIFQQII